MKSLIIKTVSIFTIVSLMACSSKNEVSPSSNSALKRVSPNGKAKDGAMQKSLDTWLKDDWSPTISKEKEENNISSSDKKSFTLQEYVDKAKIYIDKQTDKSATSHVKKVESLPVIGKRSKR